MVASAFTKFLNKPLFYGGMLVLNLLFACGNDSQDKQNSENVSLADSMAKGLEEAETVVEDFDFKTDRLKIILEGYFNKYGNREFLALKDYYAPTVSRFINLKNIPAKRISEEARKYFEHKTGIGFFPLTDEVQMDVQGNHCTIKVKTNINWSIESNPRDTTTAEGMEIEIKDIEAFSAPVIIELVFNEKYKIVSYQELEIVREKIKLKNTVSALPLKGKTAIDIPSATWISKGEFYKFAGSSDFGTFGRVSQQIFYNKEAYWIDQQALYEEPQEEQ